MTCILVDAGSLVCSGATIDLNATEHMMTANAYWTVPQVPAKGTTNIYNLRLGQAQFVGIEGPSHKITGIYDDTGRSYNNYTSLVSNGAYYITGSMLGGIVMAGSMFALIDEEVIKCSNYGSGSMAYVVPVGYNVSRAPSSAYKSTKKGYIVKYSIDLKQVQV